MSKKNGFTLLELLVVIAIIGILSAVILASLNSTKGKGRTAAAQAALNSAKAVANTCLVEGRNLNSPVPGTAICTGGANWPAIPAGWSYQTGTSSADCHDGGTTIDYNVNASAGAFKFCAFSPSTSDGKAVSCTETGCQTVNYI